MTRSIRISKILLNIWANSKRWINSTIQIKEENWYQKFIYINHLQNLSTSTTIQINCKRYKVLLNDLNERFRQYLNYLWRFWFIWFAAQLFYFSILISNFSPTGKVFSISQGSVINWKFFTTTNCKY